MSVRTHPLSLTLVYGLSAESGSPTTDLLATLLHSAAKRGLAHLQRYLAVLAWAKCQKVVERMALLEL